MRPHWELILDSAQDGATNMAVDARILSELDADERPRTVLRFYSWSRPTVSLGRNQKIERAVDVEYCRDQGLDVVHRPTGGRAVLHDDEMTYAVVSNDPSHFGGGGVYATYRRISEGLAAGYRRLGVEVTLAPDTRRMGTAPGGRDYPCFVSPSRYELMVGGRKLAGSAQRRLRRAFLQHGSMPISCDRATLARATRLADAALLETEMTGIVECTGRRPEPGALIAAFVGAFEDTFDVDLHRSVAGAGPLLGSHS